MTIDEQKKRHSKDTQEREEMHREIVRHADQAYDMSVRTRPAPEPSVLRIVDTVTTYGAYQEPI